MKKILTLLLVLSLLLTLFIPTAYGKSYSPQASSNTKKVDVTGSDRERLEDNRTLEKGKLEKSKVHPFNAKSHKDKETFTENTENVLPLVVNNNLVSMTEVREIDVEITFDYVPELDNLEWTFGGLPFAGWKKWSGKRYTPEYTGEPFITFSNAPVVDGQTVRATIKFDLVYGETDLSSRSVRILYPALIGTYDLAVKDTSTNNIAQTAMKLNVYDSYHTYDELKPAIDEIFAESKPDRYLDYQVIGQSVEGRDFHFIVLAEDKASVNKYLNSTVPMMLENPALLQEKINSDKMGDYKVPIFINNIHPDEAPGIDAQLDALKLLATQDSIEYKTTDENGDEQEVILDVDELLHHVIFVMNLTENPDGRYHNIRQNANGFDVNRDNGYQTQIESRIVVEQIAKWNPISFLDLHGFVEEFLIEPCTPPHDPNYEYDLLLPDMLEEANQMGRAGVANTKYDGYIIPYIDYGDGWDDGAPAYTATYAMHQGALGHTIEMPELNQDSNDAVVHAIIASGKFVLDNKDRLFLNQLEYYRRGVEGIDAESVDDLLVNADGVAIGRPRGNNTNFFPEYYVLPVDDLLQKNALEVYHTVEYLLRNGIKVDKATQPVTIDGIMYPVGSFVVDMHQAKRGLANTVLYKGYDASDFDAMYAEIVMNFPALRGFDIYEVRTEGAFTGKTDKVSQVKIPYTNVWGNASQYVIQNTNNDAIRAVNQLLSEGKPVELILDSEDGYAVGDFLVSKDDLKAIMKEYLLSVTPFKGNAETKVLKQPKVEVTGSSASAFVLKDLGFEISDSSSSNVIVDDYGAASIEDILEEGKGYVGTGIDALAFVKELSEYSTALESFNYEDKDYVINPYNGRKIRMYYEGLLKSSVLTGHPITSGYQENEYLYLVNAAYISSVPSDATVLATVSQDDDFFVAGWMKDHEALKGKILAMTQDIGPSTITVFANTLVNKAHPQHSYRLLANAIYNSLPEAVEESELVNAGKEHKNKN